MSSRMILIFALSFITPFSSLDADSHNNARPNITVVEGQDVSIECFAQHLTTPSTHKSQFNKVYRVLWYNVETQEVLWLHDQRITQNPRISVLQNADGIKKLQIKNVIQKDSGNYRCQVNTSPMQTTTILLNVLSSPKFLNDKTSSDVEFLVETRSELMCSANGNPIPKITWLHKHMLKENNTELKAYSNGTGKLIFKNFSRDQEGSYVCIAENGIAPSVSRSIRVRSLFKPEVIIKERAINVYIGYKAVLFCFVEAFPQSSVHWLKNNLSTVQNTQNIRVKNRIKSSTLTLSILEIVHANPQHDSEYTCIAQNEYGKTTKNATINVVQRVLKAHSYNSHNSNTYKANNIESRKLKEESLLKSKNCGSDHDCGSSEQFSRSNQGGNAIFITQNTLAHTSSTSRNKMMAQQTITAFLLAILFYSFL